VNTTINLTGTGARANGFLFRTEDFDDAERFYDDGESEYFFNDDYTGEAYANDDRHVNTGYKRRRNNQPNPYYSDKYAYRTSDYDQDNHRQNEWSNNYCQYNREYDQIEDHDCDYFQGYSHYGKNTLQENR
jgi:hypothetical protein